MRAESPADPEGGDEYRAGDDVKRRAAPIAAAHDPAGSDREPREETLHDEVAAHLVQPEPLAAVRRRKLCDGRAAGPHHETEGDPEKAG